MAAVRCGIVPVLSRRRGDGARGRTRTGMELPPRDFLTRYSFRCCAGERRICGLDFLFAVPHASTG